MPIAPPDPAPLLEPLALRDGYAAHARWWLPARPGAAIVYLHGIQSHGGWYEHHGADLARHDCAVLMPDRRGSGRNAASRGDIDRADRWLEDLADAVTAIRTRTGLERVHVFGVSWGGKLATAAANRRACDIATLTLIAPGIYPRVDLPGRDKMRVAWSLLADPHRHFPIPIGAAEMFTRNPHRLDYIRADELSLQTVTGVFLVNSRRLDRVAQRLPTGDWRGDVHLQLAGNDEIIDNAKTRDWFGRLPGGDHRLSQYGQAAHTLEFEPDPQPIRDDARQWVLERA
jgi:alpha-beta hydrolase superfamily lysophospholipase